MQISCPCVDTESVSHSIALVVTELLYPQLLEELQDRGMASTDATAILSSPSCPLLELRFELRGFEMDDPWDLSKVCRPDELHCRVLTEESLAELVSPVQNEHVDESETHCRIIVETKQHHHLQLTLTVSIRRK